MTDLKKFQQIALIARPRGENIIETLLSLKSYLRTQQVQVVFEKETASLLSETKSSVPADQLGQHCDLIIAVGGDGSLLRAARIAAAQNVPVLGINRGRLGFLTDIRPEELSKVGAVLAGEYIEEKRFLLNATIEQADNKVIQQEALNDVVLLPGAVAAQMIEFAIYIDQQFVYSQRADGLIVTTPTGSTAYALSGGGPILHPSLNAVALVPMFPHTLSSRPIVVSGDSAIEIVINEENEGSPCVSCDGQERIVIPPGGTLKIQRNPKELFLIHPKDYNYFDTLRMKLGWVSKF